MVDTIEQTRYQLSPTVGIESSVLNGHTGDILEDSEINDSWYRTVRSLRKEPTVHLARTLIAAPILSSPWVYQETEDAPKDALDFIREELQPIRFHLLKTAILGVADYGWQPFEKQFILRENGKVGIHKVKPLLQDRTFIKVVKSSGAFDGFYQQAVDEQITGVSLDVPWSLLFNSDVEGTNWYGQSLSKNVELTYNRYKETAESSGRYDSKIAGSHWIIKYPVGFSTVSGKKTDNFVIAQGIKKDLKSSGILIIPKDLEETVAALNEQRGDDAWSITLISSDGKSGDYFIAKMKYLDSLFVRGFGFPERSILEGNFGTKAEAGAHGDFALTNIELRHQEAVLIINWHLVNQLLRENFGTEAENTVYISPTPLVDEKRQMLASVYDKILASPSLILEEYPRIDMKAVREGLEIPEDESFVEDEDIPVLMMPTEGTEDQEGDEDEIEDGDTEDESEDSENPFDN